MYTAMPCIVIAVRESLSGGMVDIQLTTSQKFQDGEIKERPSVLGVPVSYPVSSTSGVLFPVKVGTTGLAIFSMRDMESWKGGNGRVVVPNSASKYAAKDAIFLPGIQPPSINLQNPQKHLFTHSTEDVVVFNNIGAATENEVRLKSNGDVLINTNQDVFVSCKNATVLADQNITMSCTNFDLDCDNLTMSATAANIAFTNTTWNGSVTYSGNYSFNGINFGTHRHPETGTNTTGPIN